MTFPESRAYIVGMSVAAINKEKRIFSLQEARELLPLVRKITVAAVAQVNNLVTRLENLTDEDPEYDETRSSVDNVVRAWQDNLQRLGCDIKGLWLVDFDNGQGYYCWNYPEDELDHFHGYDESFNARTRIC